MAHSAPAKVLTSLPLPLHAEMAAVERVVEAHCMRLNAPRPPRLSMPAKLVAFNNTPSASAVVPSDVFGFPGTQLPPMRQEMCTRPGPQAPLPGVVWQIPVKRTDIITNTLAGPALERGAHSHLSATKGKGLYQLCPIAQRALDRHARLNGALSHFFMMSSVF